jgi:hypothetical protein
MLRVGFELTITVFEEVKTFDALGMAASVIGGKSHYCYLKLSQFILVTDHLCGLVVRVLGYRSGGPDSIPGTSRKKR